MLGVLGGMGPLASIEFMRRLTVLTPASRDQEHIPAILWSDPRVPDRTAARLGGGEDPLPWLLEGIRGLEKVGCGAIVIPCNTAHGWHSEMAATTPLPILHIVDAAADELRRRGLFKCRVGVLGTTGTLKMGLYQGRLAELGYQCLIPTDTAMSGIVMPAIRSIKAGEMRKAREGLLSAATLLAREGASAVVLGCTEIPLVMSNADEDLVGVPLIDTIEALARIAIEWARESEPAIEAIPCAS